MNLSAEEYAGRTCHPDWERELARILRTIPEPDRLDFLGEFLSVNYPLALLLARRCLSERKSFEILLEGGLNEADASGIRYWLECVVPHLGIRRVVRHLLRRAATNPEGVRKARYWLSLFQEEPGYSSTQSELKALREV